MAEHKNKFFMLDDQNIVRVDEQNQENYFHLIYDREHHNGLMEVLYLLTKLMKNENSVLDIHKILTIDGSKTYEKLGTEKLINFTGERSSTNRMKQQIVYASNLHEKVLNYIFNCK